jgi:hypothetical protein
MIAHIVLFRPRADLTAEERTRFAGAFERSLRDIPTIRRAHVGRRTTIGRDYERLMRVDYPYAAVLEFDDVDGLRAYLAHPAHEELGARLFASAEETLVYDFEMGEGAEGIAGLIGN